MAKKRLVFPEKVKLWIDARTLYKLSHAQIEMARELGMIPGKFEGIARHEQEVSKRPLSEFIEEEYLKRYGKSEPDDRRSIEQKLKAEHAQKQQKLIVKAQTKAAAKWDALPQSVRSAALENVWCGYCEKTTTITAFECQTMNDGLIVSGTCALCGKPIGRYIEGEQR